MKVEEWFAARESAYADFEAAEDDPSCSQEEVNAEHRRFREVRWLLRKWKQNESEEWREEWRQFQRLQIGYLMDQLRGGPEWRQDRLGDA